MSDRQKKILEYILYTLIVFVIFLTLVWLGHFSAFQQFITKIENGSFDLRQAIIAKYKNPNKEIVIVAVDDASYEYVMDKFGSWPITRQVWAQTARALEEVNPKYIIFDLLFLKPNLNDVEADNALIEVVKEYKNIYLSMNFDNYSDEIRKSPELKDSLKLKLDQGYLYDNRFITFKNARTVMPQLSEVTDNIGAINVTRDDDGIIRNVTPVYKYKDNYYPNLSFRAALDMLDKNSISIIKNSIFIDNKHSIPLDVTKRSILNWYGRQKTYSHIPFWQVVKAQKEGDIEFLKEHFENKIIYIGTTATSLADIKSTPIETNMSGVEIHATFLNNIIDNNFIKKTTTRADFAISIILSLIVGYFVLKTTSVVKSIIILFAILLAYAFLATFGMLKFNLWISIVFPVVSIIMTFIFVYCEKYILKSKDYEETYKLAVTDGLTQLYNHRYFQEQMIVNVNNFKRYGNVFSLILIDIDFFKKFNDTYGHQSGDAVLKQVAAILKKNTRTSDIVCRYGGEEMAVILTNTPKKDAVLTANKICIAVRSHRFLVANGQKVQVTISMGVAAVGVNGENPQEIIEYSDKCLYYAKEHGRNQVVSEV